MFEYISPKAAKIIKEECYMDDVVTGADSQADTVETISEIEKIAAKGGFQFKEFTCTGKCSKEEKTKVLGLNWQSDEDK